MTKFRKKPVVIEAKQWFEHGDHGSVITKYSKDNGINIHRAVCDHDQIPMRLHGWIKTLEGGHIVCPGDWIITGVAGKHYPCKPDIFEKTYDEVN